MASARGGRGDGGRLEIIRPAGPDGLELHIGTAFAHSYPRHWHDGLYVGAITGGEGVFDIGGNAHRALTGSLVVLTPGEVHGHESPAGGRSFRTLHLETASALALSPEHAPALRSIVVRDAGLLGRFLSLHRILERSRDRLLRESRLVAFLGELARTSPREDEPASPTARERDDIRRAREYLDAARRNAVSLQDLASIAGMSPFHFHRLFRRQTGLAPHEYLIRRRLLHARKLLRRGAPAAEVAADTGFADQSHLTRHFKRILGLPPAAYARRSKNVQDEPAPRH